ncbi:MAG: epoxyqueuosine reductase QueH [bacterium]
MKKKLLLHICCGPCSTAVLERLTDEFDITLHWFNPNISPQAEHDKRFEQIHLLPGELKIIVDENYMVKAHDWFNYTKEHADAQEGGARCEKCFDFRLRECARVAKANSFDIFTTTLSVSPQKNAETINRIGEEISLEFEIEYLQANFKKANGYLRSIELSKEYGLYRQNYCGCIYSLPHTHD